jgi:hypothetical protein
VRSVYPLRSVVALVRWSLGPALVWLFLALPMDAAANGDPASHVLIPLDNYVPLAAARSTAAAELAKATDEVYRKGYRIKVAVIATREDLGTVPDLFGHADEYALLLANEITFFYVGPVLVVMPNGFGLYDGGRSVAAERRALQGQRVAGRSAVKLIAAATAATRRLAKATALRSKDIVAPNPILMFTLLHPGEPATLSYRILEDSKWAAATVTVFAGERALSVFRKPLHRIRYLDIQTVPWTPPNPLPSEALRFCVSASDRAGNRRRNCLPLRAE